MRALPPAGPAGSVMLRRARLDAVAGVITLGAAAMCLGAAVMFFCLTGQDMQVTSGKLSRWFAASLPLGAILVFAGSAARGTPWFAGIMAGLVAWLLPLSPAARLAAFLALCVVFGATDIHARMRRARA
ncbi:hypothetical protein IHN32_01890 [Deinococcus sp. 14RED07]|uniref:hypothetical protein n=1 Tax=Deinococcus sp. 14RED07 TaxID=2745874 RepID=UPI001E40DB6F|nr:hypothetical protein [Deinococcus sp. 14RED07]MCD0174705.1 hypothetical protein [Deinococcus sp. 14RED07]